MDARCHCWCGMQGEKVHVKSISAGSFFGEVALVQHVDSRAADCTAKGRVKLLSLGRDAFERLMGLAETILAGQCQQQPLCCCRSCLSIGHLRFLLFLCIARLSS